MIREHLSLAAEPIAATNQRIYGPGRIKLPNQTVMDTVNKATEKATTKIPFYNIPTQTTTKSPSYNSFYDTVEVTKRPIYKAVYEANEQAPLVKRPFVNGIPKESIDSNAVRAMIGVQNANQAVIDGVRKAQIKIGRPAVVEDKMLRLDERGVTPGRHTIAIDKKPLGQEVRKIVSDFKSTSKEKRPGIKFNDQLKTFMDEYKSDVKEVVRNGQKFFKKSIVKPSKKTRDEVKELIDKKMGQFRGQKQFKKSLRTKTLVNRVKNNPLYKTDKIDYDSIETIGLGAYLTEKDMSLAEFFEVLMDVKKSNQNSNNKIETFVSYLIERMEQDEISFEELVALLEDERAEALGETIDIESTDKDQLFTRIDNEMTNQGQDVSASQTEAGAQVSQADAATVQAANQLLLDQQILAAQVAQDQEQEKKGLSTMAIVGISAAVLAILGIIVFAIIMLNKKGAKPSSPFSSF